MQIRPSKKNLFIKFIESLDNSEFFGDHPIGLSLYNPQRDLYFLLLPKNASASLTSALIVSAQEKWAPALVHDQLTESQRIIVILRDPVDRFVSATNMMLTTSKHFFTRTNSLRIFNKEGICTEDPHFQPQYKFLQSIDLNRADFFYFNQTVVEDILKHYKIKYTSIPYENKARANLIKTVDNDLIKEIYKEDYKLINSVKFINV